jgi:ubiquinone/menaquinone biosynthesis C-methylase UbiE
MSKQLFDSWPEQYNRWFKTPIGALVKEYEQALILDLLRPRANERIVDVGCGTGIFTRPVIAQGAEVVGIDVSKSMLHTARGILPAAKFLPLAADMRALPFRDDQFDKTLSVTALEFVHDAEAAIAELFRVTRPRGYVVIATLNCLSPWAKRRRAEAGDKAQSLFRHAYFRSPQQLRALVPGEGIIKTAIHFQKATEPSQARAIEAAGNRAGLDTGAFVIGCWQKP